MHDWDMFRIILAVSRHGGLSGAARALGVTHATVARRLAQAEAALGAKLFDRYQSGLTPTEAGAAAAARAEAIEAEVLALDLTLTPGDEGPLSITVPPLLMRTHLARDLAELALAHPRLSLSVLSDNRVFNLHRREADIAIRVSRNPAESLWGRKLTSQRSGWFASPGFAENHAAALAGALERFPVISFAAWPAALPKDIDEHMPGAFSVAVCDDMLAAVGLARAGLGALRAPFFVADGDAGLVRLDSLPAREYAPIWLLTHPDLRRTPRVRLAMRFLADRFAANTQLYLGPGEAR